MDEEKDEKIEETEETEETTEETTEDTVTIEPDFEALYNERTAEVDKLKREVTDLHRDREELQRKLDDATRAFSIIADRLGMIDVADVVETAGDDEYVEVVNEDDFDKYITY
ncbi:MAG: hypothetical protein IKJ09_11860 [Bacteroidaceae bacterium]|nr:hypothetical protein [Bacteroidaceae bacterium]